MVRSKYYHYVDKNRRNIEKAIGFIAQDVRTVIPNAVTISSFVQDYYGEIENPQWSEQNSKWKLTVPDLSLTENHTGQ